MRAEDIVPNTDECLVWAFSALDLRFSANPSDPLVPAHGRVARLSCFGILPSARKHLLPPSEKPPEERDLLGGRRRHGHSGGGEERLSRSLPLHARQSVQLFGHLGPFPVECDQPAF